jgi:hypothetical protein
VNLDLLAHVTQLVVAVGMGLMTLSCAFSFVLGLRTYRAPTRSRDLALAAANVAGFASLFAAMTFSPTLTDAVLWSVPGQVALAVLIFRLQSPQAEKRISLSVHESRHARSLA